MTQKHEFQLSSQERVDGLTKLLAEILPQLNIKAISKGAWREEAGPDFAEHDLLTGSNRLIGHYNFERMQDDIYKVFLDLSKLPSDNYEKLARIIGSIFPEIQFPAYTG